MNDIKVSNIEVSNIEIARPDNGVVIYDRRRAGNSTRLVDGIIQLLFTTDTIVIVRDHYQDGKHENANKDLFNRVMKRLTHEHGLTFNWKDSDGNRIYKIDFCEGLIVNPRKYTLQLIR